MKTIKRYFSLGFYLLKFNIRSGFQYKAYLIGWLIANPLQFLLGFVTINVVISKFQPLGGWEFGQVVFLYGLGIISHGLSVVFFIQTWYMGHTVTEGGFDRLIVRPVDVFFQFCFDYFNFIGFTDLIPGVIIFIYGCITSNFQPSFINIVKVIIAIIGAVFMRGGIYTITGSLAFWTKRSGSLTGISLSLFDYAVKYPMSIYPEVIQGMFTFLVPLGFISFYPSSELLNIETGFSLPGSLCLWALAVGVGIYGFGILLFNKGMSRYESAGS